MTVLKPTDVTSHMWSSMLGREADSAHFNLQWTKLAPSDGWLPKTEDRSL